MAQEPNVIDLYEGAVHQMLPILGGVKADQLGASTPCIEWTVQNLIIHNIKGNNTVDAMQVGDPIPSEGAVDAFTAGTNDVLNLLKTTDDLMEVIETPFGDMPIAHFAMFLTIDIIIHKWDIAKGTGQSTAIDAGLAESTFGALQMGAEIGRQFGLFASEVEIPLSASIQDKLLAASGRQP